LEEERRWANLEKRMTSNNAQEALQTFSPTLDNLVRKSVGKDFAW